MAMLGDLLAAARDRAGTFQAWLRTADPDLASAVEAAASAEAVTPTSYVRAAIADFTRFASEEDWATLTSTLKRSNDPGIACLVAMVDWRLTAKACPEHSHQLHPEGVGADERSDPRPA
jgi:hypothetical protein